MQLTASANAFAERWVRSIKEECLSKLILFGERSLRRALADFTAHYHGERNHQGKGNCAALPCPGDLHLPQRLLSQTPRRPTAVLLPGRMTILTQRGPLHDKPLHIGFGAALKSALSQAPKANRRHEL